MAIVVPSDRSDVPMVAWMNAITRAVNASSAPGVDGDIWRGKTIRYAVHNASTTVPDQFGVTFAIGFGTGSNGTVASTTLLTSRPRLVITSGGSTNSSATLIATNSTFYWLGNAAGLGGFRVEFEFGVVTTQTTMRIAVGLRSAAAMVVSSDPSAMTDFFALACDAGDTNMQIMHNDGSGTATKVDLGSSFPKTNDVVYRVVFTAEPNASSVDYEVTRLDSAATATGTISTDLVGSTAFMRPSYAFGNGSTASAVAGCVFRYLSEQ